MKNSEEKRRKMEETIKATKEKVDPAIEELLLWHGGKRFKDPFLYFVRIGGKRLRPALVFLSTMLLEGDRRDAVYPAAAIEILHNYSLLIDDMIDNSETRRGNPTVWKKWGIPATECMGMHYAASVFRGALCSPDPSRVSLILSDTLQVLVEGEMLDILQERKGRESDNFFKEWGYDEVGIEDAVSMMEKKTAKLFEASCKIGGICAKASEESIEEMGEYGFHLGMAFQIRDDILDIFGDEKKFGKKIGKDIEERKGGNVVILFALEERKELKEFLEEKENLTDNDLKKATSIISETEAKNRAIKLCEEHAEKAKEKLQGFPQTEIRDIMDHIVNELLKREK